MERYYIFKSNSKSSEVICKKCHIDKSKSDFYTAKSNKTGLTGSCKECIKKQTNKYYHKNPDRRKTPRYFEKMYVYNRSDRKCAVNRKYRLTHTVAISAYKKERRKTAKHKEEQRNQRQRLLRENPNYKIAERLRGRVNIALKRQGVEKSIHTVDLVGCSWGFLKGYLESLFTEGMSWGNYGYYGWHIDHIKPCSIFDLTKEEEQYKAFHYTNLQPLWAKDNMRKGAKLIA